MFFKKKPGLYKLRASYSAYGLVRVLVKGGVDEVEVLVPEGATLKEIDKILSDSGVISPNELTEYREDLEGFLFPDTYKFHIDSEPKDVVQKFLDNFDEKVSGLLGLGAKNNLISDTKNSNAYKTIILASLLEKELTDFKERRIVSGILQKRIKSGWPLQVDATICYVVPMPCHPITPLDLKIDSPYNTYINKGLPPTPIANPGLEAIRAAINPQQSSYWFYLSDPKTGKTIFSKDLEEHSLNRALYLR
ncbi:MAG: endolytic transglycosylase MltG [Candidatus Liptonbacteria bacterium]|nr:endolytic transglycosylase MltG [Candidatus Liptonbacteria bacterium]